MLPSTSLDSRNGSSRDTSTVCHKSCKLFHLTRITSHRQILSDHASDSTEPSSGTWPHPMRRPSSHIAQSPLWKLVSDSKQPRRPSQVSWPTVLQRDPYKQGRTFVLHTCTEKGTLTTLVYFVTGLRIGQFAH